MLAPKQDINPGILKKASTVAGKSMQQRAGNLSQAIPAILAASGAVKQPIGMIQDA